MSETRDIGERLRRYRESIYRDPGVEDEHDPAFIATQLRGDSEFLAPVSTRRFPFDADRVEAFIVHVQAGTEPKAKVRPDDLRRAFVSGRAGSDTLDAAVASVLAEFDRIDLTEIVENSGATPREAAAFFRKRGGFGWPVVWCLNAMTEAGPRELPFALEKQVLAGNYEELHRWA